MKKILTLLLVLVMCVSSLAILTACGEPEVSPLENAKNILFAMYKDTTATAKDYEVVSQIKANGVTYPITWTTDKPDNATVVVGDDGVVTIKITPSQEADVTYKLTATLKDAEGNEIKVDFTRTIAKMKILTPDTEISIKDAIELGLAQGHNQYTDGKFYVSGVITEVYNTQYGNMYIEDAEGNKFTIYGTYSADGSARYDAMEVKPVAGDTVTVYGIVGQYNDAAQIKNGWITKHTPAERTDAEKISLEKDGLSISTSFSSNGSETLPATGSIYNTVAITWEFVGEHAAAVIEEGQLVVTRQATETTFVLKATLTLGEASETKEFTVTVAAEPTMVAQVVTNPVAGTAYKFFINQKTIHKELFFNGQVANSYYLGTAETFEEGVDVILEAVQGGYKISFTVDGAKKYISIVAKDVNGSIKYNTAIVEAASDAVVFAFNTEYYAFTTVLGDVTVYLGTYGTFTTISASTFDHITEAGSFVAQLVTMVDKSTITDDAKVSETKDELDVPGLATEDVTITLPAVGTKYSDVTIAWELVGTSAAATLENGKLVITLQDEATTVKVKATITSGNKNDTKEFTINVSKKPTDVTLQTGVKYSMQLVQAGLSKVLYFDGTLDKYLGTTEDATAAIAVYLEAANDGYLLYFMNNGVKTYITIEEYQETYWKGRIVYTTTAPTTPFTWNETKGRFELDLPNEDFTLGTYSTYTTISATTSFNWDKDGQYFATLVEFTGTGDGGYVGGGDQGGGDVGGGDTPALTTSTIAAVIAGNNGEYQIEGTVLAVNARSFLVKDNTGIILVYVGSAPSVAAGDVVTVKGTSSVYGSAKQLGSPEVTKTGTATVEHGTATALDAAAINAYATASTVTPLYVTVTATLVKSGNYYNLNFDGADITGSIPYPANSAELDALAGKTVDITGYVVYVSGSNTKYLNILAINVVAVQGGGNAGGDQGGGDQGGDDTPTVPVGAATLDLLGTTTRTSYSTTQIVHSANGITYTNDKAGSTNNCYDMADNNYATRAYQNSTITIEYQGMTKIVLVLDDYQSGKYLTGLDGMEIMGTTITRENDIVTITFDSAVNKMVSGQLAKQIRIESITVYTE